MSILTAVLPESIHRLEQADRELSSGTPEDLKLAQMDVLVVLNSLREIRTATEFIPDERIERKKVLKFPVEI